MSSEPTAVLVKELTSGHNSGDGRVAAEEGGAARGKAVAPGLVGADGLGGQVVEQAAQAAPDLAAAEPDGHQPPSSTGTGRGPRAEEVVTDTPV
jgi:hypothetical protein